MIDGIGYTIIRLEESGEHRGWVRHGGIQPTPDGLRRSIPTDELLQRRPMDWSIISADGATLRTLLPPDGNPIAEEEFHNLVAAGIIKIE